MRRLALLLALAACARAAAPAPRLPAADPESVAVWGAALDAEYLDDQTYGRFEMIVDTLAQPIPAEDPISLDHLRRWRLPDELMAALATPEAGAVRIDVPAVDRATGLRLTAEPSDPRAAAEVRRRHDQQLGAVLVSLSRVVFTHDRRMAMVEVFVSCGNRCGRGALLVMRRGDDGRWVVAARPRGSFA